MDSRPFPIEIEGIFQPFAIRPSDQMHEFAAAIEGASPLQTFWYLVFPLLRPVATTIMIPNALWIWNDDLLPSLVLFQDARTLSLTTYCFYGRYTSQYGQAIAGLVLSTVPILACLTLLKRYGINAIAQGAIK